MKFCPTCETRYDEEILRFCTKDGAPLVDENQPNFTEMPSESIETPESDLGEETIVRYKPSKDLLEPEPQPDIERSEAPRIVIPMSEQKQEQQVRSRNIPPYQPLQQKPNTGKVVALTILGTLTILAFGLGLFWFLRDDESSANKNQMNVNTNPPDTNLNTNLNFGAVNYNISTNTTSNFNTNVNVSTNLNTNLKTPTPKPSPSPSPTNEDVNANVANTSVNTAPPSTPKPAATTASTPNATPKISPTTPPSGRPPGNSGTMP